jgi:N-acetylglucosamine-6-phosphate deacetylase
VFIFSFPVIVDDIGNAPLFARCASPIVIITYMITDTHIHGIGGFDTRSSDPGHILRVADIEGSDGVEEIILTVYPATIKVMRETLAVIRRAMELQPSGVAAARSCYPGAANGPARIAGVHLEGPFLNPSMCGSLNAMVLISPDERNFDALVEGYEDMIRIMTVAPELDGAARIIRKASDMGIITNMGHSDATFSEAGAGHKAGARGITHLFNAMRPYHHREPGIAGYGLLNPDIYVEVIADPFHLHPATLELIFRTKKHDRIIIVSDSVKETPKPESLSVCEGVTDSHGRLLGGAVTVTRAVRNLSERFDAAMLARCISDNPAGYLAI